MSTPPTDMPPTPRPVTPADRTRFKKRVDLLIRKCGLSGRRLEDRIGEPRGTLAKVASGRVRLTRRLLDEIAQVLCVPLGELVAGTAFEDLQREPPTTSESTRVAELEQQADELRTRLAARDATIDALQAETQALGRERDQLADDVRDVKRRAADLEAKLQPANDAVEGLRKELVAATDQARAAHSKNRQLQGILLSAKGEREELLRQVEAWRSYAQERDEWLERSNAEAHAAQARLQAAKADNTGATVFGALLGVLGTAMLSDSRPSRRQY